MKLKLLFIFSRIFFLAAIVIFQLTLAYKIDIIEFAYTSFGFSVLSIAMIAYTFGFNQFLMYQFSRENTVTLDELFSKLFRVYLLNFFIMSLLIFTVLQFYSANYLQYGLIFTLVAFLLSLRDYLNVPYIIQKKYHNISISNFLISLPFYMATIITLYFIELVPLVYIFTLLIFLLGFIIAFYDLRKHFQKLNTKHIEQNIFYEYKSTFAFGISVFLFTIYYQLSNILLPILEVEKVVATFGVVFIYLGIIYILLNIVFNQIILPNMYRVYKQDTLLYSNILKRYKLIFTFSGIAISAFSLLISNFQDSLLFQPIMLKYPLFLDGISYISLGILARYIATVYSGNMNVIGQVSLKIKVQVIVTILSFITTYWLISTYSFFGACIAYSLTETLLLIGYLITGHYYVKKT